MAGPGGREVGRVSVRAVPDTSNFAAELHAYLERIERRLELEIPVSLDAASVARTEAELGLLTRDRQVNVEMNTQALVQNVSGVTRGLARWAPLIAGAAVVLGGLVAALPAAVLAIAAPLAAIVLGFDGIKEAAKGLKDEFEGLKQSLSGTFEQLLTPGFERLADLFPVLGKGLGDVATGMSRIFDAFSRAITSQEAMATLGRIFSSIGETFAKFAAGGGVDALVNSLLILADIGAQAMASVDWAALFRVFNDFVIFLNENGELLTKAMEGIAHAFVILGLALGVFVGLGLLAFGALEILGEELLTFATVTVPGAFAQVVEFVTSLPGRIVEGLASLPGLLAGAALAGGVAFLDALLGPFDEAIALGVTTAAGIVEALASLPGELGTLGANAGSAFLDALAGPFDEAIALGIRVANEIASGIAGALDTGSPSRVMMQLGQWTGEGFQIGMEKSLAGVEASATNLALAPIHATSTNRLLPPEGAASEPTIQVANFKITDWAAGIGQIELAVANGVTGATVGAIR